MKLVVSFFLWLVVSHNVFSQNEPTTQIANKKGQFYFYWGWNGARFTKSDIHFEGDNYDFTLKKVVAKHRPSPFTIDKYLNPLNMTIPQHNFRVGYYIRDNYNISFGFDHMKYVVQANQSVKISGHIEQTGTVYDGTYSDEDLIVSKDFLELENTDGLNYMNLELRRLGKLYSRKNLSISIVEGLGVGFMFPKTDATLLNHPRHDKFRVAGYGIAGMGGVNISIRKHFFIQTEFKTGFINLPWLRTTSSKSDKASQHFFFYQYNIVFGTTINIKKDQKID